MYTTTKVNYVSHALSYVFAVFFFCGLYVISDILAHIICWFVCLFLLIQIHSHYYAAPD